MGKATTTPSGATVEAVDFPPLPPSMESTVVKPGQVMTGMFDADGKLYILDEIDGNAIKFTREDGRKFRGNLQDMWPSDRPFPKLPDYLPMKGHMVRLRANVVRGWKTEQTVMVGANARAGKVQVMLLDGSGRYASVPIAAVTKLESGETVTATIA